MAKDVTVHCGFPKTATRTLQTHVFPCLSGVSYMGTYANKLDRLGLDDLIRNRHSTDLDPRDPKTAKALEILRNVISSAEGHILISYEGVLSATLRPRLSFEGFGAPVPVRSAAQQLDYVNKLIRAAGCEGAIRILITLREQSDFLPSFYAENYKEYFSKIRGMKTFSDYLTSLLDGKTKVLDARALDYCHLEDVCTTTFGAGNTKFLPYEWLGLVDKVPAPETC